MTELIFNNVPESGEITDWIREAADKAFAFENKSGDITVVITTEDEIRELNSTFRNIDRITDVLSFPAKEGNREDLIPDDYFGDIVICLKRAQEQAEEYEHSLKREIMFLTVHGCLHLMGYDHMTQDEEKEMFAEQDRIMNFIGVTR